VGGNYKLGRHKANIGASIGISCVKDVGLNAIELLKTADAALYRAKADGRGNFKLFDPEINGELMKRRFMENELRQAVKRKQLKVAYQPIIDYKTGEICGYEALARWKHPKLGDVRPDIFIQLAEECGEIEKIGEYILLEACQEIAKAKKKLNVSINVSAVQFRSYQFLNTVLQTLEQSHLRPEQLTLEMTETALIANPSLTGDIISGLQNLGVKVSLDDFGSGNASLSYLQRYKFDKIKIDRSYISGTQNLAMNKAILNAVTSLGRDLQIEIIAEGIETQEQHDKVKEQGCDYGQGWLYGKAKFAEEWEELTGSLKKAA
jgi:predicted signal transduction protein with EAL and GGDEF domain